MNVDYSTKIPNNVNLSEDRQVLKALEGWHPGYMDWWGDMGPEGFQQSLVYLRTAYSVDPRRLGQVRLRQDAGIPLGHFAGAAGREPRHSLRRKLRQAGLAGSPRRTPRHAAPPDRDPGRHRAASVEQQRHLGKTAPSLY
jgi:benzoyl-CoA 2,3-dioxygenase component B